MKNKKHIILIAILAVAGIAVIITGVLLHVNVNTEENKVDYKNKKLSLCVSEDNCPTVEVLYPIIEYKTSSETLRNEIDKMNESTNKYYEQASSSDVSDESCSAVKDIYTHSLSIITNQYIYTGDDYVGMTSERYIANLCTNESESKEPETFIYDVKEDKILSQTEIREKFNITQEDIDKAIEKSVQEFGQDMNFTVENTYQNGTRQEILFLDRDGNVLVSYFQNETNSYYSNYVIKK